MLPVLCVVGLQTAGREMQLLALALLLSSPLEATVALPPVAEAMLVASYTGPVELPEPDEKKRRGGRINVRKGRHSNRYKLKERTFGVSLIPSYAIMQGDTIKASFADGIGFTLRGVWAMSSANQFFFDLSYSRHDMSNPRAMFFRTAVTSNSEYSGVLQIYSPAFYYTYSFPIGAGTHSRALFMPRLYLGMGPLFTQASGRVTNAGDKGTVTGQGSQPFLQFTPGFLFDVRVMEHAFVGLDMKYRITIPTSRPNQTKEFAIPKVYVFEPGLSFTYMFW